MKSKRERKTNRLGWFKDGDHPNRFLEKQVTGRHVWRWIDEQNLIKRPESEEDTVRGLKQ